MNTKLTGSFLKVILTLLLPVMPFVAQAQIRYDAYLQKDHILVGSVINLADPDSSSSGENHFVRRNQLLSLEYTTDALSDVADYTAWSYSLVLKIMNGYDTTQYFLDTLSIQRNDSTPIYRASQYYDLPWTSLKVSVLSVCGKSGAGGSCVSNPETYPLIPSDIELSLAILKVEITGLPSITKESSTAPYETDIEQDCEQIYTERLQAIQEQFLGKEQTTMQENIENLDIFLQAETAIKNKFIGYYGTLKNELKTADAIYLMRCDSITLDSLQSRQWETIAKSAFPDGFIVNYLSWQQNYTYQNLHIAPLGLDSAERASLRSMYFTYFGNRISDVSETILAIYPPSVSACYESSYSDTSEHWFSRSENFIDGFNGIRAQVLDSLSISDSLYREFQFAKMAIYRQVNQDKLFAINRLNDDNYNLCGYGGDNYVSCTQYYESLLDGVQAEMNSLRDSIAQEVATSFSIPKSLLTDYNTLSHSTMLALGSEYKLKVDSLDWAWTNCGADSVQKNAIRTLTLQINASAVPNIPFRFLDARLTSLENAYRSTATTFDSTAWISLTGSLVSSFESEGKDIQYTKFNAIQQVLPSLYTCTYAKRDSISIPSKSLVSTMLNSIEGRLSAANALDSVSLYRYEVALAQFNIRFGDASAYLIQRSDSIQQEFKDACGSGTEPTQSVFSCLKEFDEYITYINGERTNKEASLDSSTSQFRGIYRPGGWNSSNADVTVFLYDYLIPQYQYRFDSLAIAVMGTCLDSTQTALLSATLMAQSGQYENEYYDLFFKQPYANLIGGSDVEELEEYVADSLQRLTSDLLEAYMNYFGSRLDAKSTYTLNALNATETQRACLTSIFPEDESNPIYPILQDFVQDFNHHIYSGAAGITTDSAGYKESVLYYTFMQVFINKAYKDYYDYFAREREKCRKLKEEALPTLPGSPSFGEESNLVLESEMAACQNYTSSQREITLNTGYEALLNIPFTVFGLNGTSLLFDALEEIYPQELNHSDSLWLNCDGNGTNLSAVDHVHQSDISFSVLFSHPAEYMTDQSFLYENGVPTFDHMDEIAVMDSMYTLRLAQSRAEYILNDINSRQDIYSPPPTCMTSRTDSAAIAAYNLAYLNIQQRLEDSLNVWAWTFAADSAEADSAKLKMRWCLAEARRQLYNLLVAIVDWDQQYANCENIVSQKVTWIPEPDMGADQPRKIVKKQIGEIMAAGSHTLIPVREVSMIPTQGTVTSVVEENTCGGERYLHWEPISGAVEYDLEWVYIDNAIYKTVAPYNESSNINYYAFSLAEPVRVTVKENKFPFPKEYPNGKLYFRVRGVGRIIDNTYHDFDQPQFFPWVYNWSGYPVSAYSINFNGENPYNSTYENNLNWQWECTYAEEGKFKKVISYHDGMNRGRQVVTHLSTDNLSVVGETLYDHEGRAAVQVLPYPETCKELSYRHHTREDENGNAFDKEDFELDAGVKTLKTSVGVSQYYSSNNPFMAVENPLMHTATIPDAQGYPYAQTSFMRDNTGRLVASGGVGADHTLNGPHATRYFYANASETELKRLFGKNVGAASHYKKNAVLDANGQLSVAYVDQEGRSIATALAGLSPENVVELESNVGETFTQNLIGNNIYDPLLKQWTVTYNQLNEVPNNEYTFAYAYGADVITLNELCTTCAFDLEIYITDAKQNRLELNHLYDNDDEITGTSTSFVKHIDQSSYSGDPCTVANLGGQVTFKTTLPNVGVYTIHKILKWDEAQAKDAVVQHILNTSSGIYDLIKNIYLSQIDYTQCEQMFPGVGFDAIPDDVAGSIKNAAFTSECQSYLQQMMTQIQPWLGAGTAPVEGMGHFYDDAAFWADVQNLIQQGIATPTDTRYISPDAVAAYAGTTPAQTVTNIRSHSQDWTPELLQELVKAHREYCWYTKCLSYAQGVPYDATMAAKNDLTDGNPYGNPQSQSSSLSTPLFGGISSPNSDPVSNLEIKNAVSAMGPNGNENIWNIASTMHDYTPNADINESQAKWQTYRGGYLQAKNNAFYQETGGCALASGTIAIVKKPALPANAQEMETQNTANSSFFAAQGPACTSVCEENANAWMAQMFTNCAEPTTVIVGGIPSVQVNIHVGEIREKLIEYCMSQCGFSNPMGIITEDMYTAAMDPANPDNPLRQAMDIYEQYFSGQGSCMSTSAASETFVYDETEYTKTCVPLTVSFQSENEINKLISKLNYAYDHLTASNLEVAPYMTMGGARVSISHYIGGSAGCLPLNVLPNCTTVASRSPMPCSGSCRIEFLDASNAVIAPGDVTHITAGNFTPPAITYGNILTAPVTFTVGGESISGKIKIYSEDCCVHDSCMIAPNGWTQTVTTDSLVTACQEELVNNAIQSAQHDYDQWLQNEINSVWANVSCHINEIFTCSYTKREYHYTLYYYDQASNLVQTVPPKGVHPLAESSFNQGIWNGIDNPAHDMESRYKFNSLEVAIESETPDGGLTLYKPDNKGRPDESINAEQYKRALAATFTLGTSDYGKYVRIGSRTLYDGLGRIVSVFEQKVVAPISFDPSYYPLPGQSGVTTSRSQLTLTQYDDPVITSALPIGSGWLQQHTRARVSAVRYYDAEGSTLRHATYYSYDIHGNVKSMVTDVPALADFGQRYHKINYYYDLVSGKVNEMHYQPDGVDRFFYRYAYDADNRLLTAESSRDYISWERDAKYFYYPHGPLKRVETGHRKVQGSDYFYTVHGWLKGVNAGALNETYDVGLDGTSVMTGGVEQNPNRWIARDAFGYTLDYYNGDYMPIATGRNHVPTLGGAFQTAVRQNGLYNGNIVRMSTALLKIDETRMDVLGKAYWYDQLNRIRKDTSFITNALHSSNSWASVSGTNAYNGRYTYDANGNILTLQRRDASGTLTDNFTAYNYTAQGTPGVYERNNYLGPQNRLDYIDDAVSSLGMADQGAGNYEYDHIGNLVKDQSEQIAKIEWSVYGKVKSVIRQSGSTKPDLGFHYNASGQRYLKVVIPKNPNGTQKGQLDWLFTYYQHDAQGNVIAVYDIANKDNVCDYEMYLGQHVLYGSSRLGVTNYGTTVKLGTMNHSYQGYFKPAAMPCYEEYAGNTHDLIAGVAPIDGNLQTPGGSLEPVRATGMVKVPILTLPILGTNLAWEHTTIKPQKEPTVYLPGKKQYEFSNHLGNVLVTVSDMPIGKDSDNDGNADYYMPNVWTVSDYEPFGAPLPGRNLQEETQYTETHTVVMELLNEDFTPACTTLISQDFAPDCTTFIATKDFAPSCSTLTALEEDFTTAYTNTFTHDLNVSYDNTVYAPLGVGTTLSIVSNALRFSATNTGGLEITLPTMAGHTYTLTFDYAAISGITGATVTASGISGANILTISGGTVKYTFTAVGTTSKIRIITVGSGTRVASLDNVSFGENAHNFNAYKAVTPVSAFTFDNDKLTFSTGLTTTNTGAKIVLPTVVGQTYTASFDYTAGANVTSTSIYVPGNTQLTVPNVPASLHVVYTFTAQSTSSELAILLPGSTSVIQTATIDNFSICADTDDYSLFSNVGVVSDLSFTDKLTFTTTSATNGGLQMKIPNLTVGDVYTVNFAYAVDSNVTSATLVGGSDGLTLTSNQTVHYTFTATGTTQTLYLRLAGAAGKKRASIDDFGVCKTNIAYAMYSGSASSVLNELTFDNVLQFTTGSSAAGINMRLPTVQGKNYTLKFYLDLVSASITSAAVNTSGQPTLTLTADGNVSYNFTAGAGVYTDVTVKLNGTGTKTATVDNLTFCQNPDSYAQFNWVGTSGTVSPLNFDNALTFSTTTAGNGVKLTIPTTAGQTYTLTFDYARVTGSVTSMTVQATGASTTTISSASVTAQTYVFTAGAGASTDIQFKLYGTGTKTAQLDNIKMTYETEVTTVTYVSSQRYRFGFNGKEKIDEVSEEGNIYDYGFRIYSPRIGKFLSVDPLTRSYPWYTPYQFAGNGPICNIDLDGLEDLDFRNKPDATMTDMVDHGAPGALFQRPISSMMNIIRKDIAIISGDDEYLHGRWVVGDPDPWTEETSLYYVVEKVPTDGNPLETAMESLDALGVTGGGGVAGQAMAKVPTAYGAALREVSVTGKKVWQNFSTVGDVLNKSFKDARGLYEIKFKDGSSYIGRTINFYRRMKQHFKYDRSKFHAMIDEIESIGFLRKNANTTIKELREGEQDLIDVFRKAGKKLKNQRDEIAKTKRDN